MPPMSDLNPQCSNAPSSESQVGAESSTINNEKNSTQQDVDILAEENPSIDKMKELLDQQQQLSAWSRQVQKKILELETIYLDESAFGNVVRGWDLDGRLGPIRPRGQVDEKERLFSTSSYSVWLERKSNQDSLGNSSSTKMSNQPKGSYKKTNNKKRKSEADELYGGEDY